MLHGEEVLTGKPPRQLSAAEVKALLVTPDAQVIGTFSGLLEEMGITIQQYADDTSAVRAFETSRIEGLVLDFENVSNTRTVIEALRQSRSSSNALVFAVASNKSVQQHALEQGANFAFAPFMGRIQIKRVLQTAYGLMLRERRRYFRCQVELPVSLQRPSSVELQCTSLNISRAGIALQVPSVLDVGEKVNITFPLPDCSPSVKARNCGLG